MRLFLRSLVLLLALSPLHIQAMLDDPKWLEVDGSKLPSWSYPDRTGAAKGGVVLLLGSGTSGAWPHSLASMGEYLPDHGWHTVSIRADFEMNDFTDLAKRVNAAIDALPVAFHASSALPSIWIFSIGKTCAARVVEVEAQIDIRRFHSDTLHNCTDIPGSGDANRIPEANFSDPSSLRLRREISHHTRVNFARKRVAKRN